jgi:hypothetical protein
MPRPPYELADCPACGAAVADTVADADAVRAEVEALWAFHVARLRADTPPEHLADRVVFSQPPALGIVRCRVCGLLYRNPRERDAAVRALYAAERPDRAVLASLHAAQRTAYAAQVRRLGAVVGRRGRVLEVGSHVGGFLAAAAAAGWQAEGLDVNAAAVAFAGRLGLRVAEGDLEGYAGPGDFEVVALWTCFDQLPEPRAAAYRARTLARDGGWLVVRVPNGAFYAAVRASLAGPAASLARALLAHNNLLAFPYRHGFTRASLARLLGRTRWRVERVHGDALVPIADEWTRRWAAVEGRLVRRLGRALARARADAAPWLEVYARAV